MPAPGQGGSATSQPGGSYGRIGLIVNPIAGMGGAVALKGTDDVVDEARARGAQPVAHDRAVRFLARLPDGLPVLTCSGPMGESACRAAERSFAIVLEVHEPTTAEDTRRAARLMVDHGVDLLCFLGGDGTALDVAEAVGHEVVCLGVPSGVKMNSAGFAQTPEDAGDVVAAYLDGGTQTDVVEVVEVDEQILREGGIEPAHLGSLIAPVHDGIQAGKAEPGGTLEGVLEAARELVHPGCTLVLGPGSTMHAVKQDLSGSGTLLGVDVLRADEHGEVERIIEDATAADLDAVPDDALLLVSPIGGQGFVVGRGNQQVTPDLLSRIGWERLVVLSTAEKLAGIDRVRVDTGDPELDASAPERIDVHTGPGFRKRLPLRAG